MDRTGKPARPADRIAPVECPLLERDCVYDARTRRHRHVAHLLNMLGEQCYCGANQWVIRFGGLLPAMICCGLCGKGFNISQRLRDCGKPATHRLAGNRSIR